MPLAVAIAGGLLAALFFLSVLTGSPGALILVYLVQLPLFGVGLSLGAKAVVIAGGAATLATAAAGGALSGLLFLLVEALPPALLVTQALRRHDTGEQTVWYPPGRLVLTLVGLGL